MKNIKYSGAISIIALLICFGVVGCSSDKAEEPGAAVESPSAPVEGEATAEDVVDRGVVSGSVVDASTGASIVGATVVLQTGDAKTMEAKTSDGETPVAAAAAPAAAQVIKGQSIPPPAFHIEGAGQKAGEEAGEEAAAPVILKKGEFSFSGVPAGDAIVTITMDGYAKIKRKVIVSTPVDKGQGFTKVSDTGADVIKMGKPFDAKVLVMNVKSEVLPNVHVFLKGGDQMEEDVFTDAAGVAVFPNQSQHLLYDVTVPALNIGGTDYSTAYGNSLKYNEMIWQILLVKVSPNLDLQIVRTSCTPPPGTVYANVYKGYCVVDPGKPLLFRFNLPVSLVGGNKMTLKATNFALNNNTKMDVPVAATVSSGDVILTLAPDSPFLANYAYSLVEGSNLVLSFKKDGKVMEKKLFELISNDNQVMYHNYYINPVEELVIAADNFNGTFSDAAGTKESVVIKFSKAVVGTVKIKGAVQDGTAVVFDGQNSRPVEKELLVRSNAAGVADAKLFVLDSDLRSAGASRKGCAENGQCATSAINFFADIIYLPEFDGIPTDNARLPFYQFRDNRPNAKNSITVDVNVQDAYGATVKKENLELLVR